MPYNTYDQGDLIQIRATFTISGSYVDPTYVSFYFRDTVGTITEYIYGVDAEVVRTSTGSYYFNYHVPAYGQYYSSWYASGSVYGKEENMFYVRRPNV